MKKPWEQKWKIERDLPGGGQCINHVVSSKINVSENQFFVLKRLKDNKTPERRKRFYREVHLNKSLQHTSIPKIVDHNCENLEGDQKLYFVYPFIVGETLESYLESNTISLVDSILLAIKIADIISTCHKSGIIHRDIKPDNILLETSDIQTPILIDFGLGVEQDDENSADSEKKQLGNRFLRLPELTTKDGNRRDFRSDITLTLGIFYFLLTNEHPALLLNENGQMPHQTDFFNEKISHLSDYQKINIKAIFDRGFQNIVNDRIQSFEELVENLDSIINEKDKSSAQNYLDIVINSTSNSQLEASQSLASCMNNFRVLFKGVQNELNKLKDHIKIGIQGPSLLPDQMRIFSNTMVYQKFETSISKWFQLNLYFDGHEFLLKINASGGNIRETDKQFVTLKRFNNAEELNNELVSVVFEFIMEKFGKTLEIEKKTDNTVYSK